VKKSPRWLGKNARREFTNSGGMPGDWQAGCICIGWKPGNLCKARSSSWCVSCTSWTPTWSRSPACPSLNISLDNQ